MRYWLAVSAVLILAAALRISRLDIRPMHGDEAVHAYRFGQLLEANNYRYDPTEFHGPTLNYFTLVPALLSGQHTYTCLTEITLRIVPVFFGLILVLMPLLLMDGLGRPFAVIAAAFTAISPAFVFYSRYYIPEMLLVCFTFGMIVSGYRYARSQKWIWALRTGVFAALCFATKETSIIAFGAVIVALSIVLLTRKDGRATLDLVRPGHLVLAIIGAIVIWGLFYSSFFKNPAGFIDSFRTYAIYFERAGHNQLHIHPWYYYLQLLIYNKAGMGPPWTEGFVVVMALVGLLVIISGRGVSGLDSNLLKFIACYTVIMTVVYSAIPYKTPWCLLSFYQGMILLAAVAVVAVVNSLGRVLSRIIMVLFFLVFATDLCLEAFLASRVYDVNAGNPYVYAHPTKDVLTIARRVGEVSRAYPAGSDMPVLVVCPEGDYWPLPWYLRSFKNVGYYNDVNEISAPAPVVIASAGFEERLIGRLFDISPAGQKNLYVPLFDKGIELRPQVELRGYVTKDLWDEWQTSKSDNQAVK
ncbi:MAG: flippase activity-associated protein Agl23 [Sedimentisphaerales bacterium]|jgi:uncharacterized protein (TIGR03663 family)